MNANETQTPVETASKIVNNVDDLPSSSNDQNNTRIILDQISTENMPLFINDFSQNNGNLKRKMKLFVTFLIFGLFIICLDLYIPAKFGYQHSLTSSGLFLISSSIIGLSAITMKPLGLFSTSFHLDFLIVLLLLGIFSISTYYSFNYYLKGNFTVLYVHYKLFCLLIVYTSGRVISDFTKI